MAERMFPMMQEEPGKSSPPIPWSLAEEIYKVYQRVNNNDQTLERIAERGGFSYGEIRALMEKYERGRASESIR